MGENQELKKIIEKFGGLENLIKMIMARSCEISPSNREIVADNKTGQKIGSMPNDIKSEVVNAETLSCIKTLISEWILDSGVSKYATGLVSFYHILHIHHHVRRQ
jgi:hypothetical protein